MPLRVRLKPHSLEETLARIASYSPEVMREISPVYLARLRSGAADWWTLGFTIVRIDDETAIGTGGYKAPPDESGVVEIAYGVNPEFENRGYATEAARLLTDAALADPRVRVVIAHTVSDTGASARVLTKNGFTKTGQVVDPEDGLVWRWEAGRRV